MKYIKQYLSIALLLSQGVALPSSCATPAGACVPTHTSFVPMTVGQNLYTQYHKLMFPEGAGADYEMDMNEDGCCSYATAFDVTYRFMQTRNGSQIASSLWGCNQLVFQGAEKGDARANNALVAEYFGMGSDTDATMSLCPRLRNQVLDFQLAISGEKAWAQINIPVVWSKWMVNKSCGAPSVALGENPLDGAELSLTYVPNADTTKIGAINVNNGAVSVTNGTGLTVLFDGQGQTGTTKTNSLMAGITSLELTNVASETADLSLENITVSSNGAAAASALVGSFSMGAGYGEFDAGGLAEDSGSYQATFTVADVPAVENIATALDSYEFGNVKARQYNNMTFNPCTSTKIADIPIMVGYDFCKSDAWHLGAYLKFVIPTGTKIDQCFLKYVLTPVIGNGRHFEFGIGLSGHATMYSCDTSSFGVYGDGYITNMFGTCQTRTFDLPNQPMSRYALAYNLNNDNGDLSIEGPISAIGDINTYQGNVSATRGELMLDFIWACRNAEVGIGYAFAGQSSESISCGTCTSGDGEQYALVGNVLQNSVGAGPVTGNALSTGTIALTGATTAAAVNFFNLGSTGQAASVSDGDSAAYVYGDAVDLDAAAFTLPQTSGNCSGIMTGQVLNKLFGHIDYVWRDCAWQPEVGIVGSIGFVPASKVTANYWDLGARVGFAF
jgi:hypothetical protein